MSDTETFIKALNTSAVRHLSLTAAQVESYIDGEELPEEFNGELEEAKVLLDDYDVTWLVVKITAE